MFIYEIYQVIYKLTKIVLRYFKADLRIIISILDLSKWNPQLFKGEVLGSQWSVLNKLLNVKIELTRMV